VGWHKPGSTVKAHYRSLLSALALPSAADSLVVGGLALGKPNCVAHGGGKRCHEEGCTKSAATGGTLHCRAHGGGRRCHHEGCPKAAEGGGTPHCKAHGGGRRCQQEGCSKTVTKDPGSVYCTLCLRGAQPQPDGAEAHKPSAHHLAPSLREHEAAEAMVGLAPSLAPTRTSSRQRRGRG
jgi:hypothetical protein